MDKTLLKQQLADWIDQHTEEQIDFLSRVVQCPSDNPPGNCAPHALMTAALLEDMQLAVEQHVVPNDFANSTGLESAINLIVRERFADGPTVALNAHGDVVPPGSGWSVDPYSATVRDGWMIGRGAAVSKSDFATYTFALRALKALDVPLQGSIELHFTYDEETGGLAGPGWILQQGLSKPDYAICAGFSYNVTTAHNGCLHLQVTVRGTSAHAARPDTGHDALEAANKLMTTLYAYRDGLAATVSATPGITSPTIVIGTIHGGINTNVVPDEVTLRLDRRIIPEENPEEVEAQLRLLIEQTANKLAGIQCNVERILLAAPFKPVGDAARLRDIVCAEASTALGEAVTPIGVPLYSDARLYAEAGVATVMYGAGPRTLLDANGHRADEKVPLFTLPVATKTIAWSLLELLG
ncbi:M20/M25/M40 family metallo-hydrolase [Oxalicibacterium faecigallinarum]|uniref:Succinyl-diaminopimelate desuccinylase n=1 Tax=Oxalicibacterium faecigallinarum TaxID=573741 RepID=A0A8J3F3H7_9BURK|nr:M20/M25/M40 family metallo-hydrolase [Oxalicibacterium faecigallinarum]GGI19104.1 succinyl-diaminopimelate desuccinylase [Oxalicibacterium faecigallinarum]